MEPASGYSFGFRNNMEDVAASPKRRPDGLRLGLFLGLALLLGCTPPVLRQAAPAEIHQDRLAFLTDGHTTREEVLLRLGTPGAHFEGERILTYAYRRSTTGGWIREGRSWTVEQNLTRHENLAPVYRSYRVGNLILVFGADGRLARHSMVVQE